MKVQRFLFTATAAAMVASCAPAPEAAGPVVIPEIAGRVAGPARTCVPINSTASLRLENRHTIIYNDGSVIWLSATDCPASASDILVFHPTGSEHCRGDIVGTLDSATQMAGPSCILGDFVPYRRP